MEPLSHGGLSHGGLSLTWGPVSLGNLVLLEVLRAQGGVVVLDVPQCRRLARLLFSDNVFEIMLLKALF